MRIIIVIIFLIPQLLFGQIDKKNEGDFIKWSSDRPLTWADFRGHNTGNIKNQAAYVASGLFIEVIPDKMQDTILITLYAQVSKKESWKRKADTSDYILKHEQLHFDIAELFARKIRKQIIEMKVLKKNINSTLSKYMHSTLKDLSAMQKKYDNETNHSLNKEKQTEWNLKIADQLKSLDVYKETMLLKIFNE